MPDTAQEKETARKSCRECKYKDTCQLLKEWDRLVNLTCRMGVK